MSGAPNTSNTPVIMDARKFVRQINSGAAAKLKMLEETIERLGENVGRHLRLTAVDVNTLFYEDVESNRFFTADIKKGRRGKIHIDNIRPIQIVEEDKATHFSKNVRDLVEGICSGNLSAADKLFNKIEGQRFRSKVIPQSGWITLRDGVARHVPVSSRIVKEEHVVNIVRIFTESVKDDIEMDKGRIIRGTLNDGRQKFIIPINEYTRRRLIAHKMREYASNAYHSHAFQNMVMETAGAICEGKIVDAIKLVGKFLKEEQEFCLLDLKGMKYLVENAMATRCQFNTMLSTDVAMLMYKTNLKINRASILEAWTKMAHKSEHAGLLSNVSFLAESVQFENDYGRFLDIVFNEDTNVMQARAGAYHLSLKVIQSVLPDFDDDEVSASADDLSELIERLAVPEPDTDTILQAEELLASVKDSLVDSIQDLASFDSVPGEEEAEEEEEEEEGSEMVPLPELPGEEGEEEEEGEEGAEEEEAPPGLEGGPPLPPMESKLTPVEKMGVGILLEELESWRVHGDTYLVEDGYNSCYSDMQRYVKRCIEIGPKANIIREQFEDMRSRMVRTGTEVLADLDDDPYSESVMAALNGSDRLLESSNPNDPERDSDFWGKQSKTASSESNTLRGYKRTFAEGDQPGELSGGLSDSSGLRMDDLRGSGGLSSKTATKSDGRSGAGGEKAGYHDRQRGSGVVSKGAKPVDGRKGQNSNSGAVGGSSRMDDLQGSGGVQGQSTSETDGRKGYSTSSTSSESTVDPGPSDPALAKGGYSSVGLSMGKDHQGSGGVIPKSLGKGDGAKGDGANSAKGYKMTGLSDAGLDMSKDYQGRGGVVDQTTSGEHPGTKGKVGRDLGQKKAPRSGNMSDLQGTDGVAESITPERIAALITLSEKCGQDCSQEKCSPKCECPTTCSCKKKVLNGDDNGNPFADDNGGSDNGGSDNNDSDDNGGGKAKKGTCKKCGKPNFLPNKECKGHGDDTKKEDQYKGPSRKYKNRGMKRSAIAPVSEGHVAAFVGDPGDVADAVDQILNKMGGEDLDVADLGGGSPLDEVAPEPEAGLPDLGDEGEGEDLEGMDLDAELDKPGGALDQALGGEGGEGEDLGEAGEELEGEELEGEELEGEELGEDTSSNSTGPDDDDESCECGEPGCEKCN